MTAPNLLKELAPWDVMALPEIMSIALRIRMSIQLRSNWLVIMNDGGVPLSFYAENYVFIG